MLRKIFMTLACVGLLAGLARAQTVGYSSIAPGAAGTPTAGYFAFPVGTDSLGFDDYATTFTTPTFQLTSMRFVGGVQQVGGTIDFEFFNNRTTTTPVTGFSSTFASGGNFIYTIDLSTLPGGGLEVPSVGVLELFTSNASTAGQFILTAAPPSPGTNDPSFGGGEGPGAVPLFHAFEFTGRAIEVIPEPGTITLGLMGGLLLAGAAIHRRRRRNAA